MTHKSGNTQSDPNHQSLLKPQTAPRLPLTEEVLILRRLRAGEEGDFWVQDYGPVYIPNGWEFLPRGDAFVTRQVKKGPHWILMGQYNSRRRYTPVKGVYAPRTSIEAAKQAAIATEVKREQQRQKSQLRREKVEDDYQNRFEQACLQFLHFDPTHAQLAKEIAVGATAWACEKYSGRVGRTSLVDLSDKADLAVRAYLRHNYTDYEENVPNYRGELGVDEYLQARTKAQLDVDRFLEKHRSGK
jgi:hypothetical protein